MAKKYLIAGNWKMNLDHGQTVDLLQGILDEASDLLERVDVMACPPFTSLQAAMKACEAVKLTIGAQNMHWDESGAYTGEISPLMLSALGVGDVILGHSERRHVFGETDELIQKKVDSALSHGLRPILCIGEKLEEREAGNTLTVLDTQLNAALANVSEEQAKRLTVAYEPVWAIGTGVTATPDQAQEAHAHVRGRLVELLGEPGRSVRILYGGSVKPDNAADLLSKPDLDGALVGGASLKVDSFVGIIRAAIDA